MPERSASRTGIALTDRQRISWLRLIRSDNVGPATFRDLINHFGTAETALAMLPELSRRGGSTRAVRIATEAEAEQELERALRFGARFLGIGEPGYPPPSDRSTAHRRFSPSRATLRSPGFRRWALSVRAMPRSAAPSLRP